MDDCISRVRGSLSRGVTWLENSVKYDEKKIIDLLEADSRNKTLSEWEIGYLEEKSRLKYVLDDVLPIYALNFMGNAIVGDFLEASRYDEFWNDIREIFRPYNTGEIYIANFLYEMGLSENKYFMRNYDCIKREQTVDGCLGNSDDHVGFLRLAIALDPDKDYTQKALEYSIMDHEYYNYDIFELCNFGLALTELNYAKFRDILDYIINRVEGEQTDKGYWLTYDVNTYGYKYTYFAIKLMSRLTGINNNSIKNAIDFLIESQNTDGSWGKKIRINESTSFAILSLLSIMPPMDICLEQYAFEKIKTEQRIISSLPYFVHTSPIYNNNLHVKEIYDLIHDLLKNAKYNIKIISPYIDMYYEDIINIASENPSLVIKIITRPSKDIKGMRERIARNVLKLLEIATKGNLKTLDTIHSRLIIIDEDELLVSSADITRDSLVDEFNAGIYTKDKDSIKKSIDYFENIWDFLNENEI